MVIHDTLLLAVDTISAGIIGLVFILVVVFSVLAAKTWHWVNIVFLVLCFIAGTGAIWGMTEVYHKRNKVMKAAEAAEKDAIAKKTAADLAIYGDPTSLSYDKGTLRQVSEELSRQMAGRGRVWSRGQIKADGNLRVFTFAASRPIDEDIQLLQDVVLYAFLENQVGGQLYPARYIGSVRVVAETADDVKLEAVALADPQQFGQPTGTWTLFEKMPLDRRGIFKDAIVSLVNPETPPEIKAFAAKLENPDENEEFDITQFRNIIMGEPFLPAQRLGFDPQSKEYEALIDRYAFDGLSLGKIQNWIDQNSAGRKSLRFEPAPEEVFVKFRFDKKSTKPYQVDANGNVENDGLFTPLGHAVDPALHAGKEVEFAAGDTVLVDQKSVDGYQRGENQVGGFAQDEAVTEIDRIYVRQVRDFPFEFADYRMQTIKATSEVARIARANGVQQKSLDDAQKQIDERTTLTTALEEDQDNLKNDLSVITALANRRSSENAQFQQQIADLEQKIADHYKKIREMAVKMSRKAFAQKGNF